MGSIEGTLMAIFLTLFSMWTTLVWEARMLLKESLTNFTLIILMGLLLFYLFIVICAQFRSLKNEFDTSFYFLETCLFATVPLLCSTILTWFVCVEVPFLDLSMSFSIFYFVYIITMGKPRLSSYPISINSLKDLKNINRFVLSSRELNIMYFVPVLFSPLLHVTCKHNVLAFDMSLFNLLGIIISLLFPILLMLVCFEQQIDHWSPAEQRQYLPYISTIKLVVGSLLFACFQDHPLLDDIKAFSGLNEYLSSAAVCAAAMLLSLAFYLKRSATSGGRGAGGELSSAAALDELAVETSYERRVSSILVSICISAAAALVGVLLHLPPVRLIAAVLGALGLSEYYQRNWTSARYLGRHVESSPQVVGAWLLVLAALATLLATDDFSSQTLYFLQLNYSWFGATMSIQDFCHLFVGLSCAAVLLPPLAYWHRSISAAAAPSLLPAAYEPDGDPPSPAARPLSLQLFSVCFPVVATTLTAAQIMIREQDWAARSGSPIMARSPDDVFPPSLFIACTLLLTATAAKLSHARIIGLQSCSVTVLLQLCLSLHLLAVPASALMGLAALLLPIVSPIAAFCATAGSERPSVTAPQLLSSLLALLLALLWDGSGHEGVLRRLLVLATGRIASASQTSAAAAAVWTVSAALSMTLSSHRIIFGSLRSLALLVAAFFCLIAADALRPLVISISASPPFLSAAIETRPAIAVSPGFEDPHGLFFFLLSVLLMAAAATQFFPLKTPLSRLSFVLLFCYVSAAALQPLCFPHSVLAPLMNSSEEYFKPFASAFTISSTFFATSAVLNCTQKKINKFGVFIYLVSCSLPLAALLFALLENTWYVYCRGTFLTGILVNGAAAVSMRGCELAREMRRVSKKGVEVAVWTAQSGDSAVNPVASSLIAISAGLGVCWTCCLCHSDSGLNSDLLVPLSCLLLLCTRRGLLLTGAHPVAVAGLAAAACWAASALYSILGDGLLAVLSGDKTQRDGDQLFESPGERAAEVNLSLWTSTSLYRWVPLLHLLLLLVPLPAVFFSFFKQTDDSEEGMFVLTVLSALPVIAAQVWSVRLLGVAGILFGAYRCHEMGSQSKTSNRII